MIPVVPPYWRRTEPSRVNVGPSSGFSEVGPTSAGAVHSALSAGGAAGRTTDGLIVIGWGGGRGGNGAPGGNGPPCGKGPNATGGSGSGTGLSGVGGATCGVGGGSPR